jgi:hypothetical protein
VGIASAAVGAVLGLSAISKNNQISNDKAANGHCNGNQCDPAGADMRSSARTLANAATASLFIGGAGLASGLALYLGSPHGDEKPGLLSQKNVGIGLVALGAVTAGVGAAYAVQSGDSSIQRDVRSEGDTATVAFIAGGACVLGGAVLWLSAGSTANIEVVPQAVGARGLSVRARW